MWLWIFYPFQTHIDTHPPRPRPRSTKTQIHPHPDRSILTPTPSLTYWSIRNHKKMHFISSYHRKSHYFHFSNLFHVFPTMCFFALTLSYFPNPFAILNATQLGLVSKWRECFTLQLDRAEISDFLFNISWHQNLSQYMP